MLYINTIRLLISKVERNKKNGVLPTFDPSSPDVHPDSRVKLSFKVAREGPKPPRSVLRNGHSNDGSEIETPSESEADSSQEESDDDDAYESDVFLVRRSGRNAKGALPFSPRKSRKKDVILIQDSDDEGDDSDTPLRVVRRSTRSAKNTKQVDEDYGEEDSIEVSSDASAAPGRRAAKGKGQKKARRPKGTRPAYGLIRPISELDYDSDEDTAALRAHRNWCEKCQTSPAHVLVTEALKSKKKKGRRKKTSEDEFEDSADEEERAINQGGWVRW